MDGGTPRQVPPIGRVTEWRNAGELTTAMLGVHTSGVDGDVKVVMARTATRLARDPSDYPALLRCGTVGYLIGRVSFGGHRDPVSPDPDGAAPAARARALLRKLAEYDVAGVSSTLGPAAKEVLEGFVARSAQSPSTADSLRKGAVVGMAVAVAEAGLAEPRNTTDA